MTKHTFCIALLMLAAWMAWADLPFRQHRYETLRALPADSNAILMVGNSITDMFAWHEAFDPLPQPYHICNRGVSGALSGEVLENTDWLVAGHPYKLLLMIGTNDLGSGIAPQTVAANVDSTLQRIHRLSPRTQVIIHSILPSTVGTRTLESEREANRLLAQVAEHNGATYIDLFDELMAITSDTAYSLDGLHLTARAYSIWCSKIAPLLHPDCRCALQLPAPADHRLWGSSSMRIGYYGAMPSTPHDILIVGGEMAKCGEWNELTGNNRILNRGGGWGVMTDEQEAATINATLEYIAAHEPEYKVIYVLTQRREAPADNGRIHYLPLRALLDEDCFDGPYLNSRGYRQVAQLIMEREGDKVTHIQEPTTTKCAHTVFATTGRPFAQRIKAADIIAVKHLPQGLTWNARHSRIEGTVGKTGEYTYYIVGEHATDTIHLTVSDQLPQATPFMGLLTWNIFEDEISDQRVRTLANAIVDLGLDKAGYRYLCLDDRWATYDRSTNGHLQYDTAKFPLGLKALADYVHSRGLKFGIYSDGGTRTCSGQQPGSLGHESTDAQDFADWGFDLLKYDYCYATDPSTDTALQIYTNMAQALKKHSSTDFIYYMCEWGERKPWLWGAEAGATCWRATADTRDCWENPTYKGGVLDNIRVFHDIWPYTGINRYSDADMLMCGLHGSGKSSNAGTDGRGMTQEEYRTQMILWCMWSSPLTLCFDITTLYDGHSRCGTGVYNPYHQEDLALITNHELIALDQDPLGLAAEPIYMDTNLLVLVKPLAGGDVAVSVTNLSEERGDFVLDLSEIAEFEGKETYDATNLISGRTTSGVRAATDEFRFKLSGHGSAVWRFSGVEGKE